MTRIGFRYFADTDPDFVAIVGPEGERWTRAALADFAGRLSKAFASAGLSAGDAVAVVSRNCPEYVAVYFAAVDLGLDVVPVNWHLTHREVEFVLRDSGCRAVVAHADLGSERLAMIAACDAAVGLRLVIGTAPGFVGLSDFAASRAPGLARGPAPAPASAAKVPPEIPHRGRLRAYTSATTGLPKAVRLPAANADEALRQIVRANAALGVFPADDNVHLCASMMYHSAPLGGCDVALQMGHRLVLMNRFEPELLLRLVEAHRVTTTFMVPAMFVRLLKLPAAVRARYSTASLRFVVHGAAPCPIEVKRAMLDWWGDVLWESYGASEAQGTIVSAEEWRRYPGTVGRPMPGSDIMILGEDGRAKASYEVGLVYVLPHTGDRFAYGNDPDKTRRSYRGNYVTVGDLGYLNEEGYLFLCGRETDLIISSGMNIYPAEIEMELVQHPRVADCAVLAEPHALLGQVPKAFVQLEPGNEAGPQLTAELLRFLGTRLAAMKLPKRIEYVAALPRDPNGKLYRRRLREPAAAPVSRRPYTAP